ncbi:MAG: thiamine diphosphokinase [Saccharofermentanales bacterium]
MLGIIALGGNCIDSESLRRLIPADYYAVAADSGLTHFKMLGIMPDILVGDMDSIPAGILDEYMQKRLPTDRYDSRKNSTDSEIAVDKALSHGCDSFLFIGAFGNRLDHMLSNQMMAISLALSGMNVILTDGITFFHTITKNNSPFIYDIKNLHNNEDVISLIPMREDAEKVTIAGLEFLLDEEKLSFGTTRAVSNTVPLYKKSDTGYAAITIESGVIFFIHTKSDEYLKKHCL